MNVLSIQPDLVPAARQPIDCPLYVDVDGSLIRTDFLWESFLGAVRHYPKELWRLPGWLMEGKARLKAELAPRGNIDVSTLPLNEAVLEEIRAAHAEGRRVVMATAADRSLAEQLAAYLGVFDGIVASDGTTNLSGRAKLDAIKADALRHTGSEAFAYIGDSRADAPILDEADAGYVVTTGAHPPSFAKDATVITTPAPRPRDAIKALRVHQWLKNVFLFVPIALLRDFTDIGALFLALVGFFAFSFVASSTYVLNDLLDLRADRLHSTKRNRPFAAGRLSPADGVKLSAAVMAVGLALALTLPFAFQALLLLYIVTTVSYSLVLKRLLLLDVLSIAGLHTLRILAGGAAIGVMVSYWLLAFSIFFFLSLALVKRYTELLEVGDEAGRERTGRGYRFEDLETLAMSGLCASFSAVLVLALYINAPETMDTVDKPWVLWPVCPLFLYALMRIWILARRSEMYADPVQFALTDWRSQITFGLAAFCYLIAAYV